jgi:hypothetical protein
MKHIKPLNENWDDDDPDYDIPDDDEPTEPFKRRLDLPKWEKLFHVLYIGDHYALVYMGTDQKDLWIVDLDWGEIREDMENLGFWLVFDADPTTWEENQGGLEDFLTLAWQGKLGIKKEDLFETGDGTRQSQRKPAGDGEIGSPTNRFQSFSFPRLSKRFIHMINDLVEA